jgi:hypothetical protein
MCEQALWHRTGPYRRFQAERAATSKISGVVGGEVFLGADRAYLPPKTVVTLHRTRRHASRRQLYVPCFIHCTVPFAKRFLRL